MGTQEIVKGVVFTYSTWLESTYSSSERDCKMVTSSGVNAPISPIESSKSSWEVVKVGACDSKAVFVALGGLEDLISVWAFSPSNDMFRSTRVSVLVRGAYFGRYDWFSRRIMPSSGSSSESRYTGPDKSMPPRVLDLVVRRMSVCVSDSTSKSFKSSYPTVSTNELSLGNGCLRLPADIQDPIEPKLRY